METIKITSREYAEKRYQLMITQGVTSQRADDILKKELGYEVCSGHQYLVSSYSIGNVDMSQVKCLLHKPTAPGAAQMSFQLLLPMIRKTGSLICHTRY